MHKSIEPTVVSYSSWIKSSKPHNKSANSFIFISWDTTSFCFPFFNHPRTCRRIRVRCFSGRTRCWLIPAEAGGSQGHRVSGCSVLCKNTSTLFWLHTADTKLKETDAVVSSFSLHRLNHRSFSLKCSDHPDLEASLLYCSEYVVLSSCCACKPLHVPCAHRSVSACVHHHRPSLNQAAPSSTKNLIILNYGELQARTLMSGAQCFLSVLAAWRWCTG